MPRTRKALGTVNPNTAFPSETIAKNAELKPAQDNDVKPKQPTKGKRKLEKLSAENEKLREEVETHKMELEKSTAEMQKKEAENEDLKAQIEELSNLMSKSSIEAESKPAPSAPANPFGGVIRQAATQPLFAPKRAKTALQFFMADCRGDVKQVYPEMTVHEVNAKLKELWEDQGEENAKFYMQKEQEDKARYEEEKQEYEKKREEAERTRLAVEYVNEERKKEMALKFYEAHLEDIAKKESGKAQREEIPKPKQARSEWNFFQKHYHAELRATEKGKKMTFAEMASDTARAWRNVQKSTKRADVRLVQKIKREAEGDAARYEEEKKEYNAKVSERRVQELESAKLAEHEALQLYAQKEAEEGLLNEGKKAQADKEKAMKEEQKVLREEKKAARVAKAALPKKPRSAYNYFVQKNLAIVQSEDGITGKEAMAKLSSLWKSLDDEAKAEYEKLAQVDRARYEAEKAAAEYNNVA